MKWYFSPQLPGQVETEVTQRDQFNNDEVKLAETIVREAVQNSLDAAIDDPANIKVTFRWIDESLGLTADFLNRILEGQLRHAEEAGLYLQDIDFANPTALVIEDFGTRGLTGSTTRMIIILVISGADMESLIKPARVEADGVWENWCIPLPVRQVFFSARR